MRFHEVFVEILRELVASASKFALFVKVAAR
jgi:hypothetical protein